MNSDSALLRLVHFCVLEHQLTGTSPRYTTQPVALRLESVTPFQSASLYPLITIIEWPRENTVPDPYRHEYDSTIVQALPSTCVRSSSRTSLALLSDKEI